MHRQVHRLARVRCVHRHRDGVAELLGRKAVFFEELPGARDAVVGGRHRDIELAPCCLEEELDRLLSRRDSDFEWPRMVRVEACGGPDVRDRPCKTRRERSPRRDAELELAITVRDGALPS